MLKSLLIKDYALIEQVNVEFGKGLNIITGETGAGKSILIDAMGLLLGERASNEVIRKGAFKTVVEGIFDVENNFKIKNILKENDLEFFPELIIRREISLKGANRCFINDTPATLSLTKDIGNLLVDMHGQHEHQSLLRVETHINFLDEFGKIGSLLEDYREQYNRLSGLSYELKSFQDKESGLKEKKDINSYQIKEIDSVLPQEGEDERLTNELNLLENSEKLLELTTNIYQNLYDSKNSVYDLLSKIKNDLEEVKNIDKSFGDALNEFESATTFINDVSDFVRSYNSKIELESEHLEKIRERLSELNLIKKKYGGSIKSILEYRKKIGEEFDIAENYTAKIETIEEEIKKVREYCGIAAEKLSNKRREIADNLEKEVQQELNFLGIPNAFFRVDIEHEQIDNNLNNYIVINDQKFKYYVNGYDRIEFFISTNLGEDLKPLVKVASGGEISRIMLALKTILAKNDKLPLLIFDEIDTGVSGRIAQRVGHALKSLSEYHQIISITHLP
ncbi:MAG TPA: DNA repair protein RecN, partial [Ignavibacteria bacterium]|nr:DNA repair protein RecN [Ignavibacteria bacterium]